MRPGDEVLQQPNIGLFVDARDVVIRVSVRTVPTTMLYLALAEWSAKSLNSGCGRLGEETHTCCRLCLIWLSRRSHSIHMKVKTTQTTPELKQSGPDYGIYAPATEAKRIKAFRRSGD